MASSNILLDCALHVYDWFIAVPRADKPEAAMIRHPEDRQTLEAMKTALANETWQRLLPLEREAAVDRLLGAYCKMCATGNFDIQPIVEPGLYTALGVLNDPDPLATYNRLSAIVSRILGLYQIHAGAEDAQAAREWAHAFLSVGGVSAPKAMRLPLTTLIGIEETVAALEQRLLNHAVEGRALPPAHPTLTPAKNLIAQAQFAHQTAHERFLLFRGLLRSFPQLYAPTNRFSYVPEPKKASEEQVVLHAEREIQGPMAPEHFASLSFGQQSYAIANARQQLYAACLALAQYQWLPDASTLTHGLFQSILHPHLYAPAPTVQDAPEPGSATNPHVIESLAHAASSLRQISERKARRYYGTSARAWEARRSAGGL
ncbi:hypothetical protein JCM10450v2_006537 [Rhodotorula kratochvilovae]